MPHRALFTTNGAEFDSADESSKLQKKFYNQFEILCSFFTSFFVLVFSVVFFFFFF